MFSAKKQLLITIFIIWFVKMQKYLHIVPRGTIFFFCHKRYKDVYIIECMPVCSEPFRNKKYFCSALFTRPKIKNLSKVTFYTNNNLLL